VTSKRPSSSRWLRRQESDPYVRRAKQEGWRSRAVYKLVEIQERQRLMKRGGVVLDLGAAPGAWSQYAASVVGQKGRVIAVDLLEMDSIAGVEFVQGDFRQAETLSQVLNCIAKQRLDLVMSDMAPNITGNRSVDQPRAMYLAELAADFAGQVLKPGGSMVLKLFHGEGFDEFVRSARQSFASVRVRKPAASRAQSRETYMVATDFRV
jgi:23S rRNA (uridine2552-2'-O)-methyltransferase